MAWPLLTVHKAKGLEWSSVYVPQVVGRRLPQRAVALNAADVAGPAAVSAARRRRMTSPRCAPGRATKASRRSSRPCSNASGREDRRLAYVALTRAAERLVVTGHRWGPTQSSPRAGQPLSSRRSPSLCERGGGTVSSLGSRSHPRTQPTRARPVGRPFRGPLTGDRRVAAGEGRSSVTRADGTRPSRRGAVPRAATDSTTPNATARRLGSPTSRRCSPRPSGRASPHRTPARRRLSATSAVRGPARSGSAPSERIRRPMPRPPAAAAHRGTRFHQWVETLFGQVPLLDARCGWCLRLLDDDADLASCRRRFSRALRRSPAGRGRGAVPDGPGRPGDLGPDRRRVRRSDDDSLWPTRCRYEVVDWKTGRHPADQLQLALYRLAWAELHGVPVDQVAATFYYVATGRVERPATCPVARR